MCLVLSIEKSLEFYPALRTLEQWKADNRLQDHYEELDTRDLPASLGEVAREKLASLGVLSVEDLVYVTDEELHTIDLTTVVKRKLQDIRLEAAASDALKFGPLARYFRTITIIFCCCWRTMTLFRICAEKRRKRI